MATSYTRTAGIDIAKTHLDVACWPQPHKEQRYTNNTQGIQHLIKHLINEQVQFVAVEATGGYEQALVKALHGEGIPVHIARPKRVRDFANGHGYYAKTDAIDARVLALFAMQAKNLQPTEPMSERSQQLESLRKRREQLTKTLIAEKNRLEKLQVSDTHWDRLIAEEVRENIQQIEAKLDSYLDHMQKLINACPDLKARQQILESQRGIGRKTAAVLIAGLPELGKVNRQRIAALVGVACYAKDSSSKTGKRYIKGGRSDVRAALYMANLTHTRKGSPLYQGYRKLIERGKPKLVAQVAVMRKFLIQLNTAMREYEQSLTQHNSPAVAAGQE